MKKIPNIIITLFSILVLVACQNKKDQNKSAKIAYFGQLKTIMSGNIESVIHLDSLSNKKHLYALGASEQLKGEIQIFNSQPSNSLVLDSTLQIKDSYKIKAALLVYTEVETWKEFTIENLTSKPDIEKKIVEIANQNGIDTTLPFPFLLEGEIATLNWHVINWKENDKIHTHQKHKTSGLRGVLENCNVKILGFYSDKHKAIFTHHTTNMHLHFKNEANSLAGHVDDLTIKNSITLKLPK